jgi:hypothetical protein
MEKITLQNAFRIRNKIKAKIKDLSEKVESTFPVKKSGEAEDTIKFDGKTYISALEEVYSLMRGLKDFNIAIDKANKANKEKIITLETIKAEIYLTEKVTELIRRSPRFDSSYDAEGKKINIPYELTVNQAELVYFLSDLKKEKEKIEEDLAEANFKTSFEFDFNGLKEMI